MVAAVETMAWAVEKPWHGLGKEILSNLTPDEMLIEAGVNWEVHSVPTFFEYNKETYGTGSRALIRSSDMKVLSLISDDWMPVQNKAAFEFFNDFVSTGDMIMETAGSLKGGKIVWALAKVNESFTIFGHDRVDSYLLFSNPHEYGKAVDIRFTPIRVVCNNTLTLSLSTKTDLSVRLNHRKDFDADLVKNTLGIASKKLKSYEEIAKLLSSKNYTRPNIEAYVEMIFPTTSEKKEFSKPAGMILQALDTQPGAQYGEGTWWSALNAVTFTIDHLLGHNTDTRLTSAWYGINRQKKMKALQSAVTYAKAA